MKNLSYLVVAALLLGGCSYKNEAIGLSSYKTVYNGNISNAHKSIYLTSVSDARDDKTSIGYVQANGQITTKLYSYTDFANKYKDGLNSALKMAQFNVEKNPDTNSINVDVKIKKIQLVYNDTKKFDENLQGQIKIEVTVTQGNKVVTQSFTQNRGVWIKPSYTSRDMEPLLYTLFSSSINDIVSKLTSF